MDIQILRTSPCCPSCKELVSGLLRGLPQMCAYVDFYSSTFILAMDLRFLLQVMEI